MMPLIEKLKTICLVEHGGICLVVPGEQEFLEKVLWIFMNFHWKIPSF